MLRWVDFELLNDDEMLVPLIPKQVYNGATLTVIPHTNTFAGVAGAPYFWLNSANNSLSIRSCMGRIVSGQTDLCRANASPRTLH